MTLGKLITQDELDSLLTSLGVAEQRRRSNMESAAASLYDFRYAQRLSPEHMRLLHGRMVALTAVLNRTMSLYLDNQCDFQIKSIDIASYQQYIRNLSVNPVLGIISYGEAVPQAIWEIANPVARTALNCMLGGTGHFTDAGSREATPLERAVLSRFFHEILSSWLELWPRLETISPHVMDVVNSTNSLDVRAVDERLFYVEMEVKVASTTGNMRLCIPLSAVKRLLREEKAKISSQDIQGANRPRLLSSSKLAQTPVNIRARLTPPGISLAALTALKPGDVLDLRLAANTPFTVDVGGVAKFVGDAGEKDGQVAIKLTGCLDESDESDGE